MGVFNVANLTPCRHPGAGRDTRQAKAWTVPLMNFDFAIDTEFAAILSMVPACAGMTALGGQAIVGQGGNA